LISPLRMLVNPFESFSDYGLSIPSGTLPPMTIHEHWWMLYHETAPQPEDEQQPRPHL